MKIRSISSAFALAIALGTAAAVAALTWIPYTSAQDAFSATFPGKPTVTLQKNDSTVDGAYRNYSVEAGNDAYFVSAFHYKTGSAPAAADATYRALLKAYASGAECKISATRAVTIAATPALEAVCIDKKAHFDHLADVLVAGDYLYMIVSAGSPGHAKSANAATFRNSFALVVPSAPPPSPPPLATATPEPSPTGT